MSTSSNSTIAVITRSAARTKQMGWMLGRLLRGGDVVALTGELGTGKTVLTKGIARGLGIDERNVTSPTFTLMNEYAGRSPLYHFDAFRMGSAGEMEELGADDYFFGGGVCVIEWAERVVEALPADRLEIAAEHVNEFRRCYEITSTGPRSAEVLREFKRMLSGRKRTR